MYDGLVTQFLESSAGVFGTNSAPQLSYGREGEGRCTGAKSGGWTSLISSASFAFSVLVLEVP